MALPNIASPTFVTKIPSTGQDIEFRPFLVKEEKMLLMALEGQDTIEITRATKKIIESCVISEINVDKLATFDVEFLFLQLRGKSIGEVIELRVGHTEENAECDHKTDVKINIDDIKVQGINTHNKIMITDQIGVKVRYPSLTDVTNLNFEDKDATFKIIASCIDVVFDADSVYDDFGTEEMIQWLESLSQKQFDKIAEFFSSIPSLKYTVKWKCSKCKKEDHFDLEGLHSFFTFL